jgi:hypothetical protein
MLERSLEKQLISKAKLAGGTAIKWTAPSMAGVPDRIVILPGGKITFVELKAPGKKPSLIQQRTIEMLRTLGARVLVIDSVEGLDELFA